MILAYIISKSDSILNKIIFQDMNVNSQKCPYLPNTLPEHFLVGINYCIRFNFLCILRNESLVSKEDNLDF